MEGAPQVRLLPSPLSSGSPTYHLAHTAQAPQSSICCPNLAAAGLNSTSSALLQRWGCFACAPFFPPRCPSGPLLLLFPGSSHAQLLSAPCRGLPGPSHRIKLYSNSVPNVSALTPFHGEISGARGPGGMRVRGQPPHPAYKSYLGSRGDAMPSRRVSPWAQTGPKLKLSPSISQDTTVNHKIVDLSSFLLSLSPWSLSLPNTGEQNVLGWRPGCHKLC